MSPRGASDPEGPSLRMGEYAVILLCVILLLLAVAIAFRGELSEIPIPTPIP